MRQKLTTLAAGVSAVLCVATVVLWIRSYRAGEELRYQRVWMSPEPPTGRYMMTLHSKMLQSGSGTVRLSSTRIEWLRLREPGLPLWAHSPRWRYVRESDPSFFRLTPWDGRRWAGFRWRSDYSAYSERRHRAWEIDLPYWSIPLACAAAPAYWLYRARRRRLARRSGRCPACGYDLRATPDRCPECGTATAAPSPAKGAAGR